MLLCWASPDPHQMPALLAQTQPGASYLHLSWRHWSRTLRHTTATGSGPLESHPTFWVALTQVSLLAVSPGPNHTINHMHMLTPWVSLVPPLLLPGNPHWGISWTSPYLSGTTPKVPWHTSYHWTRMTQSLQQKLNTEWVLEEVT